MSLSARRWFCLTFLLFLLGCSAPHDNPLDPRSKHYAGDPSSVITDSLIARVHSRHLYLGIQGDIYSVIADLIDPDGMRQDSAWVSFDDQGPVPLSRSSTDTTLWSTNFSATYAIIGGYIGEPFLFTHRDPNGTVQHVGPVYLFRVIDQVPQLTSPDSDAVVGAHPRLSWRAFGANYPFTYETSVINDTGGVVFHPSVLPAGVTDISVSDSLPPGYYSWTVTVTDNLDNSSRSREGSFLVQ